MKHITRLSLFASMFLSANALAHFPLMECHFSDNQVLCEAGFSDGSKAEDYKVEMYDYEDNLVAKTMTDKGSVARFEHPQTDFYVVFDSGHEYPVEVDVVEIKHK